MPGLHIRRKGSDSPGFWYSHPDGMPKHRFVVETVAAHLVNCGSEQVGKNPPRRVMPNEWEATYGTSLEAGKDGPVVTDPEPVNVEEIAKKAAS